MECAKCPAKNGIACFIGNQAYTMRNGKYGCAWNTATILSRLRWKKEKDKTPKTNADRIRAMSDEELAEWVWGAESAGRAYGPRGKNAWLDWLKEEEEA